MSWRILIELSQWHVKSVAHGETLMNSQNGQNIFQWQSKEKKLNTCNCVSILFN